MDFDELLEDIHGLSLNQKAYIIDMTTLYMDEYAKEEYPDICNKCGEYRLIQFEGFVEPFCIICDRISAKGEIIDTLLLVPSE